MTVLTQLRLRQHEQAKNRLPEHQHQFLPLPKMYVDEMLDRDLRSDVCQGTGELRALMQIIKLLRAGMQMPVDEG